MFPVLEAPSLFTVHPHNMCVDVGEGQAVGWKKKMVKNRKKPIVSIIKETTSTTEWKSVNTPKCRGGVEICVQAKLVSTQQQWLKKRTIKYWATEWRFQMICMQVLRRQRRHFGLATDFALSLRSRLLVLRLQNQIWTRLSSVRGGFSFKTGQRQLRSENWNHFLSLHRSGRDDDVHSLTVSTMSVKKPNGTRGSGSSRKKSFKAPVTTWTSSQSLWSKFSFSSRREDERG